jgi:hypothetical protein
MHFLLQLVNENNKFKIYDTKKVYNRRNCLHRYIRRVPEPILAVHFASHNFYKKIIGGQILLKSFDDHPAYLTHQGILEVPAFRKKVI